MNTLWQEKLAAFCLKTMDESQGTNSLPLWHYQVMDQFEFPTTKTRTEVSL
jgi:hypothetical protein